MKKKIKTGMVVEELCKPELFLHLVIAWQCVFLPDNYLFQLNPLV
jgi:hypothetical protein